MGAGSPHGHTSPEQPTSRHGDPVHELNILHSVESPVDKEGKCTSCAANACSYFEKPLVRRLVCRNMNGSLIHHSLWNRLWITWSLWKDGGT